MSFDRVYPKRKDWRQPYYGSKRSDRSCRNHGSCGWCETNRLWANKCRRDEADEEIQEEMRWEGLKDER